MRICQISPVFESVPPRTYGGTERVVSYLTEELVRLGHDVTLFASGDSISAANIEAVCPRSLRSINRYDLSDSYHKLVAQTVYERQHEFDVIHVHSDLMDDDPLLWSDTPVLRTLHGRLDCANVLRRAQEYQYQNWISISDSQRTPLPYMNWAATIYHGLPPLLYSFVQRPGKYLAFLGRISHEKRVDRAVEIARQAGLPLKVAAKVDPMDQNYFESEIKPLFERSPHVEYIGEIGDIQKNEFLGNASALLFPIDWPEPFGMVMIEAMACGTPVIAFENGSVPEVIRDGINGRIVSSIPEAVCATRNLRDLSRKACRKSFEELYSIETSTRGYLNVYETLVRRRFQPSRPQMMDAQGMR